MKSKLYITLLLCALGLLHSPRLMAQGTGSTIEELQSKMYEYFSTPDSATFFTVTEQLKAECLKQGDDVTFYKAWGNQAIYEATKSRRNHGLEIAKAMKEYATKHKSMFGEYTSIHVMATVYYYMMDYDEAEKNYLKAIDVLHAYTSEQSAAADYVELVKIAQKRRNYDAAYKYGQLALREPNVSPQHQLRALSLLCATIVEGGIGSREEFNQLYVQRQQVRQLVQADNLEPEIEILHCVINGDYEKALELSRQLPAETRTSHMASIYHKMGDDAKAYYYMTEWKHVSDSLNQIRKGSLLSDYMVQLSQERLENERQQLEHEVQAMHTRYRYILIAIFVALLVYVIYRRTKSIRGLKKHNAQLDEARQAEQAAREQAEKALDVKNEFLNNISHELRTPLNPITGFSDILATPGYELQADEREIMSQHIKESSKLLTEMIDHMIELSFYESKTSLAREDNIAPNIIGRSTVEDMRPLLKTGVDMTFTTELADSLTIQTDALSVQKVLRNLLDNAIKFTEVGSIEVHCSQTDDYVRFSVTDTGIGIAPERRPHVFEMFAKTEDNVKTTGMGLGICQSIMRLLGGTISLDPDYTDGCRFIIELPK